MKAVIWGLVALALTGCGIEQIDEGYRGVKKVWGKVEGVPLAPGLYFYNPISSSILELDVREKKYVSKEACFTRDTQKVDVDISVTVFPKPAEIAALYSQFGEQWEEKIIGPVIQTALKDVIGQYIADDLVSKREIARTDAFKILKDTLDSRGVVATRMDLTNLDFDDAYEKAVEAKVVAIQKAIEAKNHTVEIEEEARQTVASARATSEAMRIKTQALSQSRSLVEYEIAQKWDGKLPEIVLGNNIPMINLDNLRKSK